MSRKNKSEPEIARRRYLSGPIPIDWLKRAAQLPGRAFHVGVFLWFSARLKGRGIGQQFEGASFDFCLSEYARELGIKRETFSWGFARLLKAGLLSAPDDRGLAKEVTLHWEPVNLQSPSQHDTGPRDCSSLTSSSDSKSANNVPKHTECDDE